MTLANHQSVRARGKTRFPVDRVVALMLLPAGGALAASPVPMASSPINLLLLVVAALGVLAGVFFAYQARTLRSRLAALEQQLASRQGELESSAQALAQLEARSAGLEQQLQDQALALEKMAYEDDLSGLPNRRAFDEELNRSVARAQRSGHPLSLLLLDVPMLEQIRQAHSEAVADLVVCDIGELLRRSLRASDMPARLHDQMFAVLLHDTGVQEAEQVEQRLGRLFAQFDAWGGSEEAGIKLKFTAAGVQLEADDTGATALAQRAERALAKASAGLAESV